jgi:hypothetical protein
VGTQTDHTEDIGDNTVLAPLVVGSGTAESVMDMAVGRQAAGGDEDSEHGQSVCDPDYVPHMDMSGDRLAGKKSMRN